MAIEFSLDATLPAPPDRVFEALTNVAGYGQWMPGLVDATVLTEGEFGVGTEFQETRRMFFRNATERFRVTACEPPQTLELTVDGSQGSSGSGHYRFSYHLEPRDDGGTQMSLRGEIGGMNRIMEFLGRLMMFTMTRALRKDHAALSAHLAAADPQ